MQLIIGLEGITLTDNDTTRLMHPCVAGVILFKRNYESPQQLKALTHSIRQQRANLFISIDHEGGRVQRLHEGFTQLPAAHKFVEQYRLNPSQACAAAEACGFVAALELQTHGIDLNYAPVLDIDFSLSKVIGDRSYGSLTQEIIPLAGAFMRGMHLAGMAAVGKHFPGHGGVIADTHGEIAIDRRPLNYLLQADLLPFKHLIQQGLDAIMPAHVIYSQVDSRPAGFSKVWLQEVLRDQLHFRGLIISDDLDMAGANAVGDLSTKLKVAAEAGCDLALLCNKFSAMDQAIAQADLFSNAKKLPNITKLFGRYAQKIPQNMLDLLPSYRAKIATLS